MLTPFVFLVGELYSVLARRRGGALGNRTASAEFGSNADPARLEPNRRGRPVSSCEDIFSAILFPKTIRSMQFGWLTEAVWGVIRRPRNGTFVPFYRRIRGHATMGRHRFAFMAPMHKQNALAATGAAQCSPASVSTTPATGNTHPQKASIAARVLRFTLVSVACVDWKLSVRRFWTGCDSSSWLLGIQVMAQVCRYTSSVRGFSWTPIRAVLVASPLDTQMGIFASMRRSVNSAGM